MRCEWPQVPFEELLSIPLRNGLTRPKRVRGAGVPMVNMGELFSHRRIGSIEMERVPLDGKDSGRDLLDRYDLLFARQSIVAEGAGKASIFVGADEPVTFESHLIRARLDQRKADPRFIFYFFESPVGGHRVRGIVNQTAAAGIRGSDLRRLPIDLPRLAEQRRIAGVLAALDDKIEANRTLAQTLEEIAATLFRARFVDFVGVEEFEESEIGPIPIGWSVGTLGELGTVRGGGTPKSSEPAYWNPAEVLWVTPTDMTALAGRPVIYETARRISSEGLARSSARLLPAGSVLLTSRATIGITAIATVPMATNQGFISIEPHGQFGSLFVLFSVREHMEEIRSLAGGSTFPEINKTNFKRIPSVLAPESVVAQFKREADPLLGLLEAAIREIGSFAALRDTLLPKLISGQIRVPGTYDPDEILGPAIEAETPSSG